MLSEHGMKIAPQTYYRWLARPVRPAELEEAYLVNAIVDIYRHNKCVYGVRKMWHAARRAGLALGRDQVGRLMRIAGVQGVRRGAHHTVTTTRDEKLVIPLVLAVVLIVLGLLLRAIVAPLVLMATCLLYTSPSPRD